MHKQQNFTSPRYWPFWVVIGIFRVLIQLPYRWQIKLGQGLGRILLLLPLKSRRTAETNLKLCFPQLNERDRKKLLQKNFESLGMSIFETALGWWATDARLRKIKTTIKGFEHLEAALQKGKGIMLCSPHFTTLELTGRIFTHSVDYSVMYRPQKIPFIEYLTHNALKKNYKNVIARQDIRAMLRALKRNEAIFYATDVDAGIKNSVFVPFFGVLTASITATSRYATLTGAAVVPVFFYRRNDGTGYDIIVEPQLQNFPSGDLEQDALLINQTLEEAIRVAPEQYLWQYKRFKTRPPGEKRFYK
jgi:KDO2-lipid IV(A) lauroyltransferase